MQLKNRIHLLRGDYILRGFFTSAFSSCSTAFFFVYNLFLGILYHMVWNFSISIYYLVLILLRSVILIAEHQWRGQDSALRRHKRLRLFRITGWLQILMDLTMIFPIYLMVTSQHDVQVGKIAAIAIATYTVYKVLFAALHYRRTGKTENYSLLALRSINVKNAVASVLTLQNTMVMTFSNGADLLRLTAWTSAGLLALNVGFTLYALHTTKDADQPQPES